MSIAQEHDTVLLGGPFDRYRTRLTRTPGCIVLEGTFYERVDDPDTGRYLGAYAAQATPVTGSDKVPETPISPPPPRGWRAALRLWR